MDVIYTKLQPASLVLTNTLSRLGPATGFALSFSRGPAPAALQQLGRVWGLGPHLASHALTAAVGELLASVRNTMESHRLTMKIHSRLYHQVCQH